MYMAQLHRGLELYRRFGMTPEFIEREIERPIEYLDNIAERWKRDVHPFLGASGYGIFLFLRLTWPTPLDAPLSVLAHNLRKALERSKVRLCSTVDLVIWKLFLGGVAADPQGEDRRWFVTMLARLMRTLPASAWTDIVEMLRRAFMPDAVLLEKMKDIWEECEAVRRL